ncbi:hypothetical protein IAR50_007172 [Cryptococcus sp. DSM 104548]
MPAFVRRSQFAFAGLSTERLSKWGPSLVFWGAGAGTFVSLLLSEVPLFQKDILRKVPVVGQYWVDTTPDSDKPF